MEGVGEGDESRLRREEERQQVVVGCSTDSVSLGVLLASYFRRRLFRAQVFLQGCPSSRVPWCGAKLPRHSPHSFSLSLSPSHLEACPAKHCVNVIRPVKPVSPLLFSFRLCHSFSTSCSFHLFPLFTSSGSEQSSLAIQMGSCVIVCVFVYLYVQSESEGASG